MSAFLLSILGGLLGGGILLLAFRWDLARRTYSLECAVADLEDKILSEIKKRASHASQESRKSKDDLAELLKAAAERQPAQQQPWWATVGGNGRV